ncbi:MAG: PAS domain S-box protein, partial [Alphaproteobacteria bacterium]|nr:PAS domain S-box protein [Alphaproteobacteria bacterium]
MLQASTIAGGEDSWQLIALACLVGGVAIAAAASLISRTRHARGAARMSWIGGALVVLACGGAAIRFITVGVFAAPPALLTRAELVTGLTLIILVTSIMAAFVDRRVAEKNALLNTALDNMNHGLMMFDKNSRVILCNQRYLDLYRLPAGAIRPGLSLREVLARRIAAGTFAGDPDAYCASVLSAVQRGESSRQTTTTPHGRIVEVVGEPLATGGWVATHQDITAERQRETSFRFLFEDNPLPMWVWDHASLRFLAVNKAALDKYGYSREQFLNLTLRDIKRTDDWTTINQAIEGDESRMRIGAISRHARADGGLIDVEIHGRSITYEGRTASLVAILDITERKRAESEVRQAREFLDTVIANVPLPIVVKDAQNLTYVLTNRAAEELFGVSHEKAMGKTVHQLLPPAEAALTAERDAEMLASGCNLFVDAKPTMTSKGSRVLTSLRVPIRDEAGKPRYILGVMEDVTERKQQEDELRSTREFLDTVIENVPSVIAVKDAKDLRYVLINRAAEQQFAVPREQAIGKTAREFLPAATATVIEARDRDLLAAGGQHFYDTHSVEMPQSGTHYVTSRRVPILDEAGAPRYILSVIDDVTDRTRKDQELRRTQKFLDTLVENMPAMLLVKDAHDLRYVLVNRATEEAYGLRSEDMIGKTAAEVFPQESREFIDTNDKTLLEQGKIIVVDEQPFETTRGMRLFSSKKIVLRDEDGAPQYLLTLSEDVTDRKRARDRIAHMAKHDALTDLPNRAAFNERLAATLESVASVRTPFAVLSVDIDRFKEVNDVFGQSVGDELLCEIARRLSAAAGTAFLARLGGDEFAVIVAEGEQPSTAELIASALMQSMAPGVMLDGQSVEVGLSIGVAVYPADGTDSTALLANANAALHRAKTTGRGSVRFFEAHMDEHLRARRAMQHELRSAIEHDELKLHYQPQARIGGEIIGFEALVRWQHPIRGLIPPGTFVPIAEESGLIVDMGEWILRAACREAASWPKPLQVAVNLSPIQFRHGDLPSLVHAILLETGLAPHRLELEVTEGVLINDFTRAVAILRRLKMLGVSIAM